MGSRTVWQRVYDNPDDGDAWRDFREHYLTPVYTWARQRVGEAAAEDVAAEVFVRLLRRVRDGRGGRVRPDEGGSYRGYVWAVVRAAALDYLGDLRERPRPLTDEQVRELAAPASLDDLEGRVREFAGFEPELDRLAAAYRAAVARLQASPHYLDQTFRVFLRVYRDRDPAAGIERECGWSRGMASKHARNVRGRLAALMGLPAGEARSYHIVQLMAIRYGDPS